jgi:hypothetical protein
MLDMIPLISDHHAEVGNPLGGRALKVDYERYLTAERAGRLHVASARDDGELAGYVMFVIGGDTHHEGVKRATTDIVYLAPEYRVGLTGLNFMKFAFESARKIGCSQVYFSGMADGRFDRIMEKLGFAKLQTLYGKEV